jgi:hypothetical protein
VHEKAEGRCEFLRTMDINVIHPKIFYTGSWFRQGESGTVIDALEAQGFEITLDWTKPAHQDKPHDVQYLDLKRAIRSSSALFVSLEGMKDRTDSSSFHMLTGALLLGIPVVVFDPHMDDYKHYNDKGEPVHQALRHIMGQGVRLDPLCHYIKDYDEAMSVLCNLFPHLQQRD